MVLQQLCDLSFRFFPIPSIQTTTEVIKSTHPSIHPSIHPPNSNVPSETDEKCFHWVFYLGHGRCDLKTNGGAHNADVKHMVVGHSKRYLKWEREEGSKRAEL